MEVVTSLVMIIFGASGDLTKRKLIPALYFLHCEGRLPTRFKILGVGRTVYSDEGFRSYIVQQIERFVPTDHQTPKQVDSFVAQLHYLSMEPSDASQYGLLRKRLSELDLIIHNEENYLYYMATPPSLYGKIPLCLKQEKLNRNGRKNGVKRIVVEKPFGYDLQSALKLNKQLTMAFSEEQIFRIDHFLGKETVLNIMALRFMNGIFEPLWNRNYIDRIEVTAVENLGIELRGAFYDGVGALRDMVQNHLIQLVAVVAMEPPSVFNADNFRAEVVKVYRALKQMTTEEMQRQVVRGQYMYSSTGKEELLGYRNEKNVPTDSRTETFVALKMFIDNWRWEGVPIYLRTGKQMPTKVTEIVIHFKTTPHLIFGDSMRQRICNKLIIRIQPNEGVVMRIAMKVPGEGFEVKDVSMDFTFDRMYGQKMGDAYARLLEDAMKGDATLFTRSDAVEASWRFFDPILRQWQTNPNIPLCGYPAGTWGPMESEQLMKEGDGWTNPCKNLTNTDIYCEL